ncbi:unnamed protein product [Linum tenue]|uniref:Uncharacterized protein n=1 Tax=Linum tenue TaxID=586396 RepID=A0AAV0GTI0_9ROSI|nr:unnamed protein product [Linum tenue]
MQWYYLGCALCSKAAIDYDGVDKWCDDHRRLVPQQTQNFYKLRVTVDDNTGSAAFVLLGRAADLLVGLTANDLSTRFPYQRNVLPQELLALEGRDFTFDVQLPKPEYGSRGPPEFTVLAVTEQEQPNSCSPALGRRARNAMSHTPPPNSPHKMPLASPYVVPTMPNASVDHGPSVASPSGSSQLAFSTPPRRPYSSSVSGNLLRTLQMLMCRTRTSVQRKRSRRNHLLRRSLSALYYLLCFLYQIYHILH